MVDIIILAIVLVMLGLAVTYIVKKKKSGVKCIGCPDGCSCSGKKTENTICNGGCHLEK